MSNDQEKYIEALRAQSLTESWRWDTDKFMPKKFQSLEPGGKSLSKLWKWHDVKQLLQDSCKVIGLGQGPGKAERRTLSLSNPGLDDPYSTTKTLYADYQIVTPGEIAPSHRHTTTAIRIPFEGKNGWTIVNDEKVNVHPFDIVVNPQSAWHTHGNEGPDDFLFLDILDIPILRALDNAV